MKTTRFASWALAALAFAAGCDGKEAAAHSEVARAAEIAKQIEAAPDDAEAVLAKYDMTEASFEALMFEIAEDPEKAEAFAEKLTK